MILFRATITSEELRTIISEIEGVMNSRPLCYNYSDDTEEVISSSHMCGRRLISFTKNMMKLKVKLRSQKG